MKPVLLTVLNLGLVIFFIFLFRRKNLLTFHQDGRIWLTYLAVGIITLMDEFTSVFYAPAESYRFIGLSAMVFIAITSLLVRFISTRLTEIAEILEHHNLIGGGVYSFSYLVLGPLVSFVAVSSIMVDYILTACISAVSAVSNAASFFPLSQPILIACVLFIIWAVAGLNILGIRENARFTFLVFVAAAFIMLNLIISGFLHLDAEALGRIHTAFILPRPKPFTTWPAVESSGIMAGLSPASPFVSWPTPGWNRLFRLRALSGVGRRFARLIGSWPLPWGW